VSNTSVCKIRFVSQQLWFHSEIYLQIWLSDNDKIHSIYKNDHSWTHQLLLSIYYCSVAICCPAIRRAFNCCNVFRTSINTAVAVTGITIDISIYLEDKSVVNKSNQLIGVPFTISDWKIWMTSLAMFVYYYMAAFRLCCMPHRCCDYVNILSLSVIRLEFCTSAVS
jgi:hypothetical protein